MEHTPIKEKLPEPTCPRCGKPMQFGYVAAKQSRLRWVDRPNTKTILAGEMLRIPFQLWSAPSYEAYRCRDCGLVLMSYEENRPDRGGGKDAK